MGIYFKLCKNDIQIEYHPLSGKLSGSINGHKIIPPYFSPIAPKHSSSANFECLTIFLSHDCNLACTYCYKQNHDIDQTIQLNPQIIVGAADYVATSCAKADKPFIMGFHGGNEPLIHGELLKTCFQISEIAAQKQNIPLHAFCTTNGVVPEETIHWAAQKFYGITVSCDGPSELQNTYRKTKNGYPTSKQVENTIRILGDSSLPFLRIRCTITKANVHALKEIVDYFFELGVYAVEMYPVYNQHSMNGEFDLRPAPIEFVISFLQAHQYAQTRGMKVTCSATRWPEPHGRFCYPMQKNLAITPDGYISACFLSTGNTNDETILGSSKNFRQIELYQRFLEKIRIIPDQCNGCFNQFHCSMGCPDVCPLRSAPSMNFECEWLKLLGLANLLSACGIEFPIHSAAEIENYLSGWEFQVIED